MDGGCIVNVTNQYIGKNFALYNGDCVEVMKNIPDNSIHAEGFSPPFASLYTYSASERDMGNARSTAEFLQNFKFAAEQLYRILMPGRIMWFHCMDMPAMKERDGFIGLNDFPGDLIRLFMDDEAADFYNAIMRLEQRRSKAFEIHDIRRTAKLTDLIERMNQELTEYKPSKNEFIYHSRVAVWKDPLIEAVRTKSLGLMHKQIVKDSSMCRQGLPDYVIAMRKPGENAERISHDDGFTDYIGCGEPTAPDATQYSHEVWRKYASPVWMDINQSNTLNKNPARTESDERHICPLQLDVIARCVELWSNPGDTFLSPFAGIGSEIYQSLLMGRKGIGIELKESYFSQAVMNCKAAEMEGKTEETEQISLF
jgi:DNA modification methylase